MRPVVRPQLLAPLAVLFCTALAVAQSPPTRGRVKDAAATVRSGPSEQMAETSRLEPGAEVTVVKSEGPDWLAVEPPRGSVSYIQAIYVQPQGKPDAGGKLQPPFNAVVDPPDGTAEVKIACGHTDGAKPLNVQRAQLPKGSIVQVIGPRVAVESDGGTTNWYPIAPPVGDVRYVQASAVALTGGSTVAPGFVVKAGKPGTDTSVTPQPAAVNIPAAAKTSGDWPVTASVPGGAAGDANWPNHPLWREAEKARIDENYLVAEKLYLELAEKANRPDGDTKLADLCYSRIQMVRELADKRKGGGWNAGGPNWHPSDSAAKPTDDVPPRKERPTEATADGVLKLVRWEWQNEQVFAVVGTDGKVKMYLISTAVTLGKSVGKTVEMAGTVTYPKECGGVGMMVVSKVVSAR